MVLTVVALQPVPTLTRGKHTNSRTRLHSLRAIVFVFFLPLPLLHRSKAPSQPYLLVMIFTLSPVLWTILAVLHLVQAQMG